MHDFPFPHKQLENHYRERIAEISSLSISNNAFPLIRFCHWRSDSESADDGFELWGGFSEVDMEIKWCLANKEQPPPVLIFGLLSLEQVRELSDKVRPLQWTGAQYLCYDVSDDDLRDAVEQVIKGAQEPVPESLRVTRDDLDAINVSIHHFLSSGLLNSIPWYIQKREELPDIPPEWQGKMDCRRRFKEHLDPGSTLDDKFTLTIKEFENYARQVETTNKARIALEKAIKAIEEESPCIKPY